MTQECASISLRRARGHGVVQWILAVLCLWICLASRAYRTPFYESNRDYLKTTLQETVKCLGGVAVIKGVADVVEGSTMGVSLIGTGTLEVGDVAQPVLDVATVTWKVMLAISAFASVVLLVTMATPQIAYGLSLAWLAVWLALLLCNRLGRGGCLFWRCASAQLKKLLRMLCVLWLLVVFVFPGTLRASAAVSRHALSAPREEHQRELEECRSRFDALRDRVTENKKELFKGALYKDVVRLCKDGTGTLYSYACFAIAATLVEGMLVPLCCLLFLFWIIRVYALPALGLPAERWRLGSREALPVPPEEPSALPEHIVE